MFPAACPVSPLSAARLQGFQEEVWSGLQPQESGRSPRPPSVSSLSVPFSIVLSTFSLLGSSASFLAACLPYQPDWLNLGQISPDFLRHRQGTTGYIARPWLVWLLLGHLPPERLSGLPQA